MSAGASLPSEEERVSRPLNATPLFLATAPVLGTLPRPAPEKTGLLGVWADSDNLRRPPPRPLFFARPPLAPPRSRENRVAGLWLLFLLPDFAPLPPPTPPPLTKLSFPPPFESPPHELRGSPVHKFLLPPAQEDEDSDELSKLRPPHPAAAAVTPSLEVVTSGATPAANRSSAANSASSKISPWLPPPPPLLFVALSGFFACDCLRIEGGAKAPAALLLWLPLIGEAILSCCW
mmetsp:Transcript_18112/g.35772  ORF Transcript_18112/g.35772 Transcript_18112/m.35772 type:complete len:234 (-) Transcript_18112:415-1116(-)